MLPCQGRCREFEPRLPLHKKHPQRVFFIMLELFKIRARDDISQTRLKELAAPLLDEFFTPLIPRKNIDAMIRFLDEEVIAKEIKDKRYEYYFISFESKYIGFIEMKKRVDVLNISRFFLKKEFRQKGFGKRIIEELVKPEAQRQNLKKIRICIDNDALLTIKIFEKLGFRPIREIARYIGDKKFIYEHIYFYDLD